MYSDILSCVKTSQDKAILLSEINTLLKSLFEPKKGVEETLKSEVRAGIASVIRAKLAEGEDLEKYLSGLAQELESRQEVKLELAFEPTEKTLEHISAWLAANVGEHAIVSLAVNSALLGGAVVSFNGKYYDGSLCKVVEETLLQNRDNLIKTIFSSQQ